MDKIKEICQQYALRLVEDCAQSHGARLGERMTGAENVHEITELNHPGMGLYAPFCRFWSAGIMLPMSTYAIAGNICGNCKEKEK